MSDLAATNCGNSCQNNCGCDNFSGNSFLWIILILLFCNGGCGCNNNSCGCDSIIWIILLLCCCGNNGGSGCWNSIGCC